MEPLTIPPSPNWYETKIAICAPDNTLIYGANNSIVIIKPAPWEKPSDISVISFAHLDRVHGLAMAPTWNEQHRMIASIGDDKLVKVWNMFDNTCAFSHKSHTSSKSRPVGVAYINDTKLVSVSEDGFIVVWKMTTNEFQPHRHLLGMKPQVTAISTCPHAGWLAAFGMRNGLVIVADLKGHGNVLYKLRAHEREVVDFAWCPKPINVIPDLIIKKKLDDSNESGKEEQNENVLEIDGTEKGADKQVDQDTIDAMPANGTHIHCAIESQMQSQENHHIGVPTSQNLLSEDVLNVSSVEAIISSEQSILNLPKLKKKNPWVDLRHADDDEVVEVESTQSEILDTTNDFLTECLALKAKIIETKEEEVSFNDSLPTDESGAGDTSTRKVLHAVRAKKMHGPTPSTDIVSDLLSDDTSSPEALETETVDTPKVEAPKSEFLLASSARGGHIVIWRAGTDGRVQRRLRMPKPKGRGGYSSRAQYNMWLSMHWISPKNLLTSGANGELMMWQVSDQTPRPILVHNDHPKQLFCITSPYCHERETYTRWEDLAAWTIGQDRAVLYTMLLSRKVLACYQTFSCPVQSSAASPIAPTRLAFGLSDGFIRVWDLSKENKQCIQMNQIKMKVGGKVLSLAWHTSEEYLLAFGTEDGQVGHVNAGQCKKPPVYFAQHFLRAIYKLEWAPAFNKSAHKHGLYCCAEGQLAIYNLDNPLANPEIVKTPKGERVTNFAWKADYSKLAIGCKSGTVYILDGNYEVKTTLYYQKKAIVSMAWHPIQTAEDEEKSPNHDWLASATSSDNIVTIYDLGKVSDELCMNDVIAGELFGHVKPVNHVFWSPYKNAIVATASEDGTVTVWSGMNPISTFLNNNAEPLLSGMWSPLGEDVIISTGKDCTVRVWNVKNHPTKEQTDLEQTRSTRKKNLTHYRSRKEEIELETNKSKRYPLLAEISVRQAHSETSVADCRAMFERCSNATTAAAAAAEDNLVLRLFGDPSCMGVIIDEQKDTYHAKGKHTPLNHLQMWTGDIGVTIKKAIADGNLTPWLISVAPMISFSLWQEAAEAYASQLADSTNSDPVEIASYYLALHKVDEAIDILGTKQMHRESLALAKLKKPDDTDLHRQILDQWAKSCEMTGRFEIAAQSFVAQRQFEEAAKVLYKRTDLPSLALAVELARSGGNDTLANTIQYRHDVLQAQTEDKHLNKLPSRVELELGRVEKMVREAKAEGQPELACQDAQGTAVPLNGDGDGISRHGDSSINDDSTGKIHITSLTEVATAEADNEVVGAVDNEDGERANGGVVGDVNGKHPEGMEHRAADTDCTDNIASSTK